MGRRFACTSWASFQTCVVLVLCICFGHTLLSDSQRPGIFSNTSREHIHSLGCWDSKYVEFHHQTISKLAKTDAGFLIFVCDGGCGGIGDRISGMLSSFFLAVFWHRVFLIEHSSPFPLEDTLVPKNIKWNVVPEYVESLQALEINLIDAPDKKKAVHALIEMHATKVPVIRLKINRYWLGMLLWETPCDSSHDELHGFIGGMTRLNSSSSCTTRSPEPKPSHTFALSFLMLFGFSPTVLQRVQHMRDESGIRLGDQYIGIHARIGGTTSASPGSIPWEDPARHDIREIDKFVDCAKEKNDRFSGQVTTSTPILLFSDNHELKRSAIIKQNKIRTVSSTIFHVDRSTKGDLQSRKHGNFDTYAELAFLSNASCIVGSLSTFSGVAASIASPVLDCFSFYTSCSDETVDFWETTESVPNCRPKT